MESEAEIGYEVAEKNVYLKIKCSDWIGDDEADDVRSYKSAGAGDGVCDSHKDTSVCRSNVNVIDL